MVHHAMAHHLGVWLAVAIGVFTAVAMSLWAALCAAKNTDT